MNTKQNDFLSKNVYKFLEFSPTQPLTFVPLKVLFLCHKQVKLANRCQLSNNGKRRMPTETSDSPTDSFFRKTCWNVACFHCFSASQSQETFKHGFRLSWLLNADSIPFYLRVTVGQNWALCSHTCIFFRFMQAKQKPLGLISVSSDTRTSVSSDSIKSKMWSQL